MPFHYPNNSFTKTTSIKVVVDENGRKYVGVDGVVAARKGVGGNPVPATSSEKAREAQVWEMIQGMTHTMEEEMDDEAPEFHSDIVWFLQWCSPRNYLIAHRSCPESRRNFLDKLTRFFAHPWVVTALAGVECSGCVTIVGVRLGRVATAASARAWQVGPMVYSGNFSISQIKFSLYFQG